MKGLGLVLLVLLVNACGGEGDSVRSIPNPPEQESLNFALSDLTTSPQFKHYDLELLNKQGSDSSATVRFNGTLRFEETPLYTTIEDSNWSGTGQTLFPAFSVSLVSDDNVIIPSYRGVIDTHSGHSYWDVIIGAGRVWQRATDQSWMRASLPIHLVSRVVGQVRNCVMNFFYSAQAVSKVHIQCDQESAPHRGYQPGDMVLLTDIDFQPSALNNAEALLSAHYVAEQQRLPVEPWQAIDSSGQGYDAIMSPLLSKSDMNQGAAVWQGVVYAIPPETRRGTYPFPNEMRHGIYSASKSMVGALSLLYLAQRYGESIFDAHLSNYIPALSSHPAWQGVTFEHALNMATGSQAKEDSDNIAKFAIIPSADKRIEVISEVGNSSTLPGEMFQYASTHTFVLSYAMQKYVEAQEGDSVLYWQLVKENVLRPIGAESLLVQHTVETNGEPGIPIAAWGAYPTLDETAKIAMLFANDGKYDGMQLLHRERTREAVGTAANTKSPLPVDINNAVGLPVFYQHSFWIESLADSCKSQFRYMAGHGGNYVTFSPSGMIGIRYSDAVLHNPYPVASAMEKLKPSCTM